MLLCQLYVRLRLLFETLLPITIQKLTSNTNILAHLPIYLEAEDRRSMFIAIDDLCPEWNEYGVDQIVGANLSAEPDFEDFRQYASGLRDSSSKRPASASTFSSSSATSAALRTCMTMPTLDLFPIPEVDILQLPTDITQPTTHVQPERNAAPAPTASSPLRKSLRRRPATKNSV